MFQEKWNIVNAECSRRSGTLSWERVHHFDFGLSSVLIYAKKSNGIQNEHSKCCFHSVAKLDVHKPPSSSSTESKGFDDSCHARVSFCKGKEKKRKKSLRNETFHKITPKEHRSRMQVTSFWSFVPYRSFYPF